MALMCVVIAFLSCRSQHDAHNAQCTILTGLTGRCALHTFNALQSISSLSPPFQAISRLSGAFQPHQKQQQQGHQQLRPPARFHYAFPERLQRGVILRRRARFTLEVDVGGQQLLCYCPTTARSLGGSCLDGGQVGGSSWRSVPSME